MSSPTPKQDPVSKGELSKAADGKIYFSYADIHKTICSLAPRIRRWKPDAIVAIGGGGFIPARMLRTEVKVPIFTVSLELYDDRTNTANTTVKKLQWFDAESGIAATQIRGKRILVVDEVDDTRTTLAYCVAELLKSPLDAPGDLAVAVVHNKLKPKKAELPPDVLYLAGAHLNDAWYCYPWDARAYGRDIDEHEGLAAICRGDDAAADAEKAAHERARVCAKRVEVGNASDADACGRPAAVDTTEGGCATGSGAAKRQRTESQDLSPRQR